MKLSFKKAEVIYQTFLFFWKSICGRGVFKTLPNIYDETFLYFSVYVLPLKLSQIIRTNIMVLKGRI